MRRVGRWSGLIVQFTAGRDFDDCKDDATLPAAAEREFEIGGEAAA